MSAYSLDLSLGLELSLTPNFGSIYLEEPMGARSGDFGILFPQKVWVMRKVWIMQRAG